VVKGLIGELVAYKSISNTSIYPSMKLGNWNGTTRRTLAQVSTTQVLNTAFVEHAHFIFAQDRPFWFLIDKVLGISYCKIYM